MRRETMSRRPRLVWLIGSAVLVAMATGVGLGYAATPHRSLRTSILRLHEPTARPRTSTPITPPSFIVPKVPTVTGPIPRTETSIPIGTAYFPGAPGSINLADYGYVEDEYFLSGTANIYQYDASGKDVEIKTPDVPYTTVILVRHPADPRKFSGRVQLEMSHPQFGVTTQVWAHNYKMFMADGDAWVRVTTSRGGPTGSSIGVAKQYDPTRYAPLNVPEDGLNWDIIGQIAKMLKVKRSDQPRCTAST